MNSRDIQRAVQARRFDRTAGDAPSLGHVARTPGAGLPAQTGRRKKRSRTGRRGQRQRNIRKKVMLAWSALLAAVAIGVLSFSVWCWLWLREDRGNVALGPDAATLEGQKRVVSRFKSPTAALALDWVKRALKVREPGQVAEYFHLGSSNPEAVAGFLRNMEAVDGPITGCDWRSSMDANELLIDGVTVNTRLGDTPRNRLALLTPDEKGRWKIDFDAFARTVDPPWSELMAKSSGQGLVRVMIGKDNYYNGPFSDERMWISYGMVSPDTEVMMLGYCRRGSPQAAALEQMMLNERAISDSGEVGQAPLELRRAEGAAALEQMVLNEGTISDRGVVRRATLEIRRTEGAAARQFEITRVLAEDWVLSARPFDQNFK